MTYHDHYVGSKLVTLFKIVSVLLEFKDSGGQNLQCGIQSWSVYLEH